MKIRFAVLGVLLAAFGLLAAQAGVVTQSGSRYFASSSSSSSSSGGGSLWTGILDTSRATDWTLAGVRGGIPTSYTKDGATITAGTTTATINSRISAAANDTYLEFGAGTFNLTGLAVARSRVILRGQGADQTSFVFSSASSHVGLDAAIAVAPSGSFLDMDAPANSANWTAGYTRGTTVITLSSTTNLAVGHLIFLNQQNDTSVTANDITMGSAVPTFSYDGSGGGGGTGGSGTDREQIEVHEVTAINGSNVTITPALTMPNWASGKSPKAWWTGIAPLSKVGIENISIDLTTANPTRGIGFLSCKDCWVKGVKSRFAGRDHAQALQSMNLEFRDGFLFEGTAHASQSYGYECFDSSYVKIENNIAIRVTSPWMSSGACIGSVFGYNFSDLHTYAGTWQQEGQYFHSTGTGYVLVEGTITNGLILDQVHGPSFHVTAFRNRFSGREGSKTEQTVPVHVYTLNRYPNLIGNILGVTSYHNTYQSNASSGTNCYTAIYAMGWGDNCSGGGGSNPADDTFVATSSMRWGNCDSVTGFSSCRFNSSEVPSAITGSYDNAVPANNNLPSSFYLSAKPSWFKSLTWPGIGPDVTGGDVSSVGGHVYSNPAKTCYEAATADGQGEITFDAEACYL